MARARKKEKDESPVLLVKGLADLSSSLKEAERIRQLKAGGGKTSTKDAVAAAPAAFSVEALTASYFTPPTSYLPGKAIGYVKMSLAATPGSPHRAHAKLRTKLIELLNVLLHRKALSDAKADPTSSTFAAEKAAESLRRIDDATIPELLSELFAREQTANSDSRVTTMRDQSRVGVTLPDVTPKGSVVLDGVSVTLVIPQVYDQHVLDDCRIQHVAANVYRGSVTVVGVPWKARLGIAKATDDALTAAASEVYTRGLESKFITPTILRRVESNAAWVVVLPHSINVSSIRFSDGELLSDEVKQTDAEVKARKMAAQKAVRLRFEASVADLTAALAHEQSSLADLTHKSKTLSSDFEHRIGMKISTKVDTIISRLEKARNDEVSWHRHIPTRLFHLKKWNDLIKEAVGYRMEYNALRFAISSAKKKIVDIEASIEEARVNFA